jgi:hypothetical protein
MIGGVLVWVAPKDTLPLFLVVRVLARNGDFISSRYQIHAAGAIRQADFAIRRYLLDTG